MSSEHFTLSSDRDDISFLKEIERLLLLNIRLTFEMSTFGGEF